METAEIQKIEDQRNDLVTMAELQQVNNQSDADEANDTLIRITAGLKEIEKKRLSFTAPINKSLREINQTFKDMTAPVEKAKRGLTQRLMEWRASEQRKIREENERLAEEARKKDETRRKIQEAHAAKGHEITELEPTKILEVTPLSVTDTTKVRKNWDFKIIDFSKVSDEYKQLNSVMVRKLMMDAVKKAHEEEKEEIDLVIEGLEFYQKEVPIFA